MTDEAAPLTVAERRRALWSLGFTQRGLASWAGWDEGTVRRWFRGEGIAPPQVDDWLRRRLPDMERDPPPNL